MLEENSFIQIGVENGGDFQIQQKFFTDKNKAKQKRLAVNGKCALGKQLTVSTVYNRILKEKKNTKKWHRI